jgi:hypothetical protein
VGGPERKAAAVRENGKKGGRPAIDIEPMLDLIKNEGDLCVASYYRTAYPAEWRKARRLDRINTWRDDAGAEYVSVGPQV